MQISRWIIGLSSMLIMSVSSDAQKVSDEAFSRELQSLLELTVAPIDVNVASSRSDNYIFLDTRERDEYAVSHIPGALFLGYNAPNWSMLDSLSRSVPIIVYCSVGYRSEKMGEKLKARGFTNVHNLYGSIFEWVNKGYPIVDTHKNRTYKLHTYDRSWSKWVRATDIEKVW